LEREKQFSIEKPELFNIWDHSADLFRYPVVSINGGKTLVCGGYFGGRIIIISETN